MKTCLRQCSSWAWRLEKASGTGDWQKYASFQHASSSVSCAQLLSFSKKAGRPCVWAARSKIHQSCLARDKAILRAQQFRDGAIKINGRFARRQWFSGALSHVVYSTARTLVRRSILVRYRNRTAKAGMTCPPAVAYVRYIGSCIFFSAQQATF